MSERRRIGPRASATAAASAVPTLGHSSPFIVSTRCFLFSTHAATRRAEFKILRSSVCRDAELNCGLNTPQYIHISELFRANHNRSSPSIPSAPLCP